MHTKTDRKNLLDSLHALAAASANIARGTLEIWPPEGAVGTTKITLGGEVFLAHEGESTTCVKSAEQVLEIILAYAKDLPEFEEQDLIREVTQRNGRTAVRLM